MIFTIKYSKSLLSKLAILSICLALLAIVLLSPTPAKAAARDRVIIQNNTIMTSSGVILRGGPMSMSKNAYNINDMGTNWALDENNWVRMKNSGLNIARLVLFDFYNTSTW